MVEKSQHTSKEQSIDEKRDVWFDNFLASVTVDRSILKMGIASHETQDFYNKVIFGDPTTMISEMRDKSTQYFIGRLVVDYLKELESLNIDPLKLYLDYNDSQVLVWAEIKEDDEVTEMALYKAEAKANAKNFQNGFHISSTILEDVDGCEVPPHYKSIFKS